MNGPFKEELRKVIENLLKCSSLVAKKINGSEFTGKEYYLYIEKCLQLFKTNDKIPEAKTIYNFTIDNFMSKKVEICFSSYKSSYAEYKHVLETVKQINVLHEMSKMFALRVYRNEKKMGNEDQDKQYQKSLEELINKDYEKWSEKMKQKIKKDEDEKESKRRELEENHKMKVNNLKNKIQIVEKEIEDQKQNAIIMREKELKYREEKLKSQNEEANAKIKKIMSKYK